MWTPDNYRIQNRRRNYVLLPQIYARLQAHEAELRAAGVDVFFMLPGRANPRLRRYIRGQIGIDAYGWAPNMIPIYANETHTGNPNTHGLQHQAADLNELLFSDGRVGPILLIIDARGIVRWHSHDWHNEDPAYSIESVVDFAARQLGDAAVSPAPE